MLIFSVIFCVGSQLTNIYLVYKMHHLPCNQLASCRRGRVRRRRPCRPSRSRWAACRSSRPTSPAGPDTARPQPRQSLRAMCEQEQLIVHRNSIRKCMMLNEQRPIREIGYNVICIFFILGAFL